jgi:hypothetical protein
VVLILIFLYRGLLLNKEATEGVLVLKLQQWHQQSYVRHHDLANRYEISVSQMTPHIYIPFVVITTSSFVMHDLLPVL